MHFSTYIFQKSLILILFSTCIHNSFGQNDNWWNETVFYEIFVRSFYDSNGDGKGDFQGLIEKLDYLNDGDPSTNTDLGITGIWLMPINESPSYHGYDVVDYRSIDQEYGTMQEFETFMQEAHARGIKVIVDFVMNHTSSQHPWFTSSASNTNSPYRSWYTWEDTDPGYQGPWGQQVWHFNNGDYYLGIFWGGMPDLNFQSQEVIDEMFDITQFWLQDVGVDGFRLDAIKHLFEDGPIMEHAAGNFPFLEDFNAFYKGINPEAVTVGEVWSNTTAIVPYVSNNRLDMCFDFSLADQIINGLNNNNAQGVHQQIQTVINSYPGSWASFLSNHDQNRLFYQLGGFVQNVQVAAATYLTLPGVPFLYYGEEIAMSGNGPDENKRRPMQWDGEENAGFTNGTPWHPINSNYTIYNVADMQADPNSLWSWYRNLIHIRNASSALKTGQIALLEAPEAKGLAYLRYDDEEQVLVIQNYGTGFLNVDELGASQQSIAAGSYALQNLMNGSTEAIIEVSENGNINFEETLSIGPKGTLLLQLGVVNNTENQIANTDIQVFPNPASEWITIDTQFDNYPLQVEIRNLEGKIIQAIKLEDAAQNTLNINDLPSNIYLLQVKGKKSSLMEKLFVE